MSDSAERDKNDSLAAKEIEAEEAQMKQELLDLNLYETGYTYKQMKDVLDIISESKNMANMANDNKNSPKESLCSTNDSSSEMISKLNLSQELETQQNNDVTRYIHSYMPNRASPILDRTSTQGSSNLENISATSESRILAHRHKSTDSEDMFDRLHDSPPMRDSSSPCTNRGICSKLKNSSHESHTQDIEVMMDVQSEYNQRLERRRFDPLDSCVSENDVPLRQPDRPHAQERELFRRYKDAQTSEMQKKQLQELKVHLKETAELWHSRRRTTDSKFQWGSPIQVGPTKGSLDKKSLTNLKTEENEMECTSKYSNERPNKRKSASILSSSTTRHSSSDDDDKEDFVIFKRKKFQTHEETSRILRPRKEPRVSKEISFNPIEDDADDEIIDINSDKIDAKTVQPKRPKENEEKRASPILMPMYPRRIVPPNPRRHVKKRHNTSVATKSSSVYNSDEELSVITILPKKKSDTLGEQEIRAELEIDEEEYEFKAEQKNTEIKPLPVKRVSVRLEKQFDLLKKIQAEKNRRLEAEKEEAQKKEIEEKRRKEEFYKRQINERQQREKQIEEIERIKKEKSTRWNNMLNTRSREQKEKVRELPGQRETRLLEIEEENRLLEDSSASENEQTQQTEDCLTKSVNCPICNKLFPSDKIETHAAECEQFDSDNDEENANLFQMERTTTKKSVRDPPVLECNICLTYKTTNGIHYEEHVNTCLQKQHREESRSYERTSIDIDNVPMSPVRCYRPISEQTDSEIDYKAQFASNSKTYINSSKRRKR